MSPTIYTDRIGVGGIGLFPVSLVTEASGGGGGPVDPPEPVAGVFTITVSAGRVNSDLSDFPLMIDLSNFPTSFWDAVRADGGNIRCFKSDGTTALPIDLTYIRADRMVGRLYVKTDLLTASDNIIKLDVTNPALTAVAVTDPLGRNAVWSDYDVVWVFPETANRTGNPYTQDLSKLEPATPWIRQEYYGSLAGDPHQGIATNKTGTFVTIDTDYLRKYTEGNFGTVVAFNATPIASTGIASVNHLGDGCIIGSELFIVLEIYPSGPYVNQHIAVFNLSDLTFNRSYDISAQAHEVSGICFDGTHLWLTDYIDSSRVFKYTTAGVYVSTVTLSVALDYVNGIEYVDGHFYISQYNKEVYEVKPDGTVLGIIHVNPHTGIGEGLCYDGESLYLLEGDGDLSVLKRDRYEDFTKSHRDRATVITPRDTVWTAATSVMWADTTGDTQSEFLEILTATPNSKTQLMYDNGPDVVGIWNTTDSWLYTDYNPVYKSEFRIAYAHNGTTERKVFHDGTVTKDASVSARPAGLLADMTLYLGATNSEGYYQFVWLRKEYMSDDWMSADADNMNDPSGFYSIVDEPEEPA